MNNNQRSASIIELLSLGLVYIITFSGTTCVFSVVLLILALLFPLYWPLLLFYPLWLWYDWDTPSQGGRPFKYCFVRRWRIFNIIRDYFPITLVKTTELDSNKNYILGYHPHGMLPDGALVCFGSEAAGFGQKFPGIKPRLTMVSSVYHPLFWPLLLFYPLWLWYDWDTPSQGGRSFKYCFVRRWRIFNIIRDYFPITLVKTTELDSNKNYILGYHPHGMLPDGALVCFGSEAAGFEQKFPGIKPRLTMHSFFKWFPGFRELAMAAGIISVSRDSLEYVLTSQGSGRCIVTLIGGASEVLQTSPSCYQLILNRRKGFIKLALKTGSSLVPVFAFGQNDMFHQPPSALPSRLENTVYLSKWTQLIIKYSLLAFHDRTTFGVMPRRKPITVVVGAPIDVQRSTDPTPEQINYLHSLYVQQLKVLFEKHKMEYNDPKDVQLMLDEE